MELKDYQQRVIDDLAVYLSTLEKSPHLAKSFKSYWDEKGVTAMDAYKNNVPGVPHVCAKVPTAGGKTYIAVNAIDTIFAAFTAHSPERPRLVVWLVPSLTILDQTVQALSDVEHPYRKRLNQLFKNRVAIFEKSDLLMGAGFSLDTVKEQLCIVVMSFDSLRSKKKEDRKIFQENGYLASFMVDDERGEGDWLLPEHDATSLINVIRSLKPVVVVDESHNAESVLSVEMLVNLNPDFILDLTATPKLNSNIISYVDAMALKLQHMVKLPVIVANQVSQSAVIESALIMQRKLESTAIAEEKSGGKYIRPIVLFQAQPRVGNNAGTYESIKKKLVSLQIPADQIKIKTADINELKGVDLMSRTCPVRYIITVNALKEGWDCPFAYILASLADKSSAVDVEQVLGRVLRMPHVQRHGDDLLNMSYVFTASNKFLDTVQSVVRALNKAGFSDKDYRTVDAPVAEEPPKPGAIQGKFFDDAPKTDGDEAEGDGELDVSGVSKDWAMHADTLTEPSPGPDGKSGNVNDVVPASVAFINELTKQAAQQNQEFEEKAKQASDTDVPAALEEKMNKHKLKAIFREETLALKLPQFFIKVETGGWFDADEALQLFERDELLDAFKLSQADSNINFEDVQTEMYRVDLEDQGGGDYSPKPFKIDAKNRARFNSIILSGSRDSQVRDVTARITQLVGNLYPITDPEVRKYVQRVIDAMPPEQLQDCLERDFAYVAKIKEKIRTLVDIHSYKAFNDLLDVDRIVLRPSFSFPESICPSANAPAIPKCLYSTEASIGGFEARVITDVSNIEGTAWWHRNLSRGKGFRINGFLNHYADFILKTKAGRIIVLETKGDDRGNEDSELKLKLGKLWEAKAGGQFKYMMVFENKPIDGAERLSDALKKIALL